MITPSQCLQKYGDPKLERNMAIWDVPPALEVGVIPKKIYCNKDLVLSLSAALKTLIETGAIKELWTWDGCFNIRTQKGASIPSLHSWGLAVDLNAAWNRFGAKATFSEKFVKCFTDNGFDWGGNFTRAIDGMHFQLSKLP